MAWPHVSAANANINNYNKLSFMIKIITMIAAVMVALSVSAADYRMFINDFTILPGETATVDLCLDNVGAVTGFQTDLVLPEGLSLKIDADGYYMVDLVSSRASRSHVIDCNKVSNGAYRIISYSPDLTTFKLNSGAVVSLLLEASETFVGQHKVELKNTEIGTADGKQYFPANESCNAFSAEKLEPGDTFDVNSIRYLVNEDAASVVVTYTALDSHDNYKGLIVADIPAQVAYKGVTYKVTGIGEKAFKNCDDLAAVKLPEGIDSIGRAAFHTCVKLTRFDVPASVSKVNIEVLRGCYNLTNINVASGNAVYSSANNCNAIIEPATKTLVAGCKYTVIPEDIVTIGDFAFAEHTGLNSASLPSTVEVIGAQAYNGCNGLSAVTLPSNVKKIGSLAFRRCNGLTSFVVPESVTEIGQGILRECSNLVSAEVKAKLTALEDWTFWGCSSLVDVKLPSTITEIKYGAFYQCKSLSEVVIPDNVTIIGEYAYDGCDNLKTVYIHDKVATISVHAFTSCNNISDVYAAYKAPDQLQNNVFSNTTYNNATLHVPAGRVTAYKNTNFWNRFVHIVGDIKSTGDVDGNGVVDAIDMNIVINLILGKYSLDDYPNGDLDGNGDVDMSDLNAIISLVLGK